MFGKKRKNFEEPVDSVISIEPAHKPKSKVDKRSKKNKKKKKIENNKKSASIFNFNHKSKDESSIVSVYDDVLRAIQEEDIITPVLDLPEFMLCSMNFSGVNIDITRNGANEVDRSVDFQKEMEVLSHNDEVIQDMLKEIEEPLEPLTPVEPITPASEYVEPVESLTVTETENYTNNFEGMPSIEDISSDMGNKQEDVISMNKISDEVSGDIKEEVITKEDDISDLLEDIEGIYIEPIEDIYPSVEEVKSEENTEPLTDEEAQTLKSLLNLSGESEGKKSVESIDSTQPISLDKESLTAETPVGMMLDMDDVQTSSIKEEL